MRSFRFGFSLASHRTSAALAETVRTAESYGYDSAVTVDHLGPNRSSPFLALLAAAHAGQRLRLGTYVLNCGFWNPSILAREVATLSRMTEGRVELGVGSGVVKSEFDGAGIPFEPFRQRMDRLEATLDELDRLFAQETDLVRPPLLLGGTSDRLLRMAAERADTVSFSGWVQVPGSPVGTLGIIPAEQADERLEFFRSVAGDRLPEIERNVFVLDVRVTDDRWAEAEAMAAEEPFLTPEQALETPFVLIGTVEEIAEQILRHRERYGFTSFTVQRPAMEAFGPAIELVRKAESAALLTAAAPA
ncbi:putative F420-dependent oxidoreductase [Kitasatospora sp. GAS204A]|uniref:TIGR03621 family F420-dependent LLM class oxidoreductase n=1 Tax=unclassified Kitasatospora TaxID=2633591 RepID=UPI00247351B7|nr:TIGR03621 family F420-dependent LLM class oxidoreductase [Kitasatospora sp. GAS204B]MDH6119167.1 putative F420-dependent oxidoreductase [Kitasatospora sp. GAS204B]